MPCFTCPSADWCLGMDKMPPSVYPLWADRVYTVAMAYAGYTHFLHPVKEAQQGS